MSKLPLVVLVGRPNVGKSTLFNRLVGERQAVVADIPGTTRDRLEQPLSFAGRSFRLADMAGLELAFSDDSSITKATQAQVKRALLEAAVLVWVVDSKTEPEPSDHQIADLLRGQNKPVLIAMNKADHAGRDLALTEYARFGFMPIIPVSGIKGRGVEELLEEIIRFLPESAPLQEVNELRLSIVGRPNVGKSTLLNSLVGEERAVVSELAGTTRDTVDSILPVEQFFPKVYTKWKQVRLIDTAGLRRRGKIGHSIESWSMVRTLEAVDRSDIVLLLLDATEGMVHQDLQVAQQVVKAGKGLILVVNKWDLVSQPENDELQQEKFLERILETAPFLHFVPVIFISAKNGTNLHYLSRVILRVYTAWSIQTSPDDLKKVTLELQKHTRLRNLQKITLEHSQPPTFHLQVEGKQLPHFSTTRFVEHELRALLNIGPTLIKIWSVPSTPRR